MRWLSLMLYDTSIYVYRIGIGMASLFNRKARKWVNGRKGLLPSLQEQLKLIKNPILIHCASFGEFEQARPVIDEIRKRNIDQPIIISFYSPSGYDLVVGKDIVDEVIYMPLDTRSNANQFIKTLHPKVAIFIKYEFWYHHLNELRKRSIPCFLVSGVFRPSQAMFKWYGSHFKQILGSYAQIFVQDNASLELLRIKGYNNVSVSADTRIDRVAQIAETPKVLSEIEKFKGNDHLLIAGSVYLREQDMIRAVLGNVLLDGWKVVMAPHEINEAQIDRLVAELPGTAVRLSEYKDQSSIKLLIVDSIGILSSIYQYGDIAFIGGGFGSGIHNILEPAAFGLPIIIGPKYKKFVEAKELVSQYGAFVVSDNKSFQKTLSRLINDKEFYENTSATCLNYINSKKGVTNHIVDEIEKYLK